MLFPLLARHELAMIHRGGSADSHDPEEEGERERGEDREKEKKRERDLMNVCTGRTGVAGKLMEAILRLLFLRNARESTK